MCWGVWGEESDNVKITVYAPVSEGDRKKPRNKIKRQKGKQ